VWNLYTFRQGPSLRTGSRFFSDAEVAKDLAIYRQQNEDGRHIDLIMGKDEEWFLVFPLDSKVIDIYLYIKVDP
jgi:hypothetical protein